ncbi:MAG: H-type lectin domain-containing protein [Candidatus Onthovivens sp.]|nr:H-type lectin domain-containing protein [Candidatus Onthovivens sp.]
MPKYLDETGLQTLWNKIVSKIGDAIPPVDSSLSSTSTNPVQNKVINSALSNKQNKLVSGTNIKTINNNSILGSGNLSITASVPTEVAKLVNSGGNYIHIERYGSNNYGMKIQTGKVSVNKAEAIHTEVKFPNSSLFSNTPVVILTPVINNTTDTRQIDTELTGVTNKGFHFSCALGNTSYRITEVHYIAIQLI